MGDSGIAAGVCAAAALLLESSARRTGMCTAAARQPVQALLLG